MTGYEQESLAAVKRLLTFRPDICLANSNIAAPSHMPSPPN
jgi:hypothetical protein